MGIDITVIDHNKEAIYDRYYSASASDAHFEVQKAILRDTSKGDYGKFVFDFQKEEQNTKKKLAALLLLNDDPLILRAIADFLEFYTYGIQATIDGKAIGFSIH